MSFDKLKTYIGWYGRQYGSLKLGFTIDDHNQKVIAYFYDVHGMHNMFKIDALSTSYGRLLPCEEYREALDWNTATNIQWQLSYDGIVLFVNELKTNFVEPCTQYYEKNIKPILDEDDGGNPEKFQVNPRGLVVDDVDPRNLYPRAFRKQQNIWTAINRLTDIILTKL